MMSISITLSCQIIENYTPPPGICNDFLKFLMMGDEMDYMAFYISPLEPRVQRMFQRSKDKLLRPRLPIAERARRAYENRALSLPTVGQLISDRAIRIGDIKLAVSGPEEFRLSRTLQLTLSHFLPLFSAATVQIWPEEMEKDHLTVDLTAHLGKRRSNTAEIKRQDTLLNIEFTIYWYTEQMELIWIKGNPEFPGYAGRALSALYNVAHDSRLSRIYYYVDSKNSKGRQFYFHMDFGCPVEKGASVWEVNLQEKAGYPLSAGRPARR